MWKLTPKNIEGVLSSGGSGLHTQTGGSNLHT